MLDDHFQIIFRSFSEIINSRFFVIILHIIHQRISCFTVFLISINSENVVGWNPLFFAVSPDSTVPKPRFFVLFADIYSTFTPVWGRFSFFFIRVRRFYLWVESAIFLLL